MMTVPEKEQKMNAGVELLLKRMETNPEEFYTDNPHTLGLATKWGFVIDRFKHHLSPEDRDALNAGLDAIYQQKFTETVLEGLVDPKPSNDSETSLRIGQMNAMPSGGTTLGGYSGAGTRVTSAGAGNTNAVWGGGAVTGTITANVATNTQLHELLHMKAQLELERQKVKQHQTIFGKLKNYISAD